MTIRTRLRNALTRPSHAHASLAASSSPSPSHSPTPSTASTLSTPPPHKRHSTHFFHIRTKTPFEKQAALEQKYADWRPPHKLKYLGKPHPETIGVLRGWDWEGAMMWRGGSDAEGYEEGEADEEEEWSPTQTRDVRRAEEDA